MSVDNYSSMSFQSACIRLKLLCIASLMAGLSGGCSSSAPDENPTGVVGETLSEARLRLPTNLTKKISAPDSGGGNSTHKSLQGNQRCFYSDGRLLWGHYSAPSGPGPHPAVVYCHSGFALGSSDYELASIFPANGFAVFCPAWRGENGNSGDFGFLWGEVTDAINAMEFLASMPDIDPDSIFIAGHSMGATTAMLACEMSARPRAAFACGPIVDLQAALESEGAEALGDIVFDWNNPLEGKMRSPLRFIKDLNCPVTVYFGQKERLLRKNAGSLVAHAEHFGKKVSVETIDGADHFTAITPAIDRGRAFFQEILKEKRQTPAPPIEPSSPETIVDQMILSTIDAVKVWNAGDSVPVNINWNAEPDPGNPVVDVEKAGLPPVPERGRHTVSRDLRWQLSLDKSGRPAVWNLETGEGLQLAAPLAVPVADGGDESFYAHAAGIDSNGRHFALRWLNHEAQCIGVSLHSAKDGQTLYTITDAQTVYFTGVGSALLRTLDSWHLLNIDSGELIAKLEPANAWEISPGGRYVAMLTQFAGQTALRVYDSVSGALTGESIHEGIACGDYLSFSHNGQELATSSEKGLTIWNFATGKVAISDGFRQRDENFVVLDRHYEEFHKQFLDEPSDMHSRMIEMKTERRGSPWFARDAGRVRFIGEGDYLLQGWTVFDRQDGHRIAEIDLTNISIVDIANRTATHRSLNWLQATGTLEERLVHKGPGYKPFPKQRPSVSEFYAAIAPSLVRSYESFKTSVKADKSKDLIHHVKPVVTINGVGRTQTPPWIQHCFETAASRSLGITVDDSSSAAILNIAVTEYNTESLQVISGDFVSRVPIEWKPKLNGILLNEQDTRNLFAVAKQPLLGQWKHQAIRLSLWAPGRPAAIWEGLTAATGTLPEIEFTRPTAYQLRTATIAEAMGKLKQQRTFPAHIPADTKIDTFPQKVAVISMLNRTIDSNLQSATIVPAVESSPVRVALQ